MITIEGLTGIIQKLLRAVFENKHRAVALFRVQQSVWPEPGAILYGLRLRHFLPCS